ncbi:MAG: cyclase [Pseudomonadota bacterium]
MVLKTSTMNTGQCDLDEVTTLQIRNGTRAMVEKRVCFDFEIDFSNGGGIQGQGFRLDIEGDDISDDDLARYIVDDMRLLMVGEVRILNKWIIDEPHKRKALEEKGSTA